MGNRIYGCDDCQLVCPWNRYAAITEETDFHARKQLHGQPLTTLFAWDESTFLKNTEGSPIRRIGHEKWLRNSAVAMGNASASEAIVSALEGRSGSVSEMVQEHIDWALAQQAGKQGRETGSNRQQQRLTRVIKKGLPRDA